MRGPLAATAACALALAGCGTDAHHPAAACTQGPQALRTALGRAPGAVTIGGHPISDCFTKGSNAGDVERVGSAWVTAAADLGIAARRHPEGEAALRLGYLLGAARRGVRNSPGLHAELLRRLEQEALPFAKSSSALQRGVRAGERVG